MPVSLVQPLKLHLQQVNIIHETDLENGFGYVYLSYALERKYSSANKEWIWKYVFPSSDISTDKKTQVIRRPHFHETAVQRAVRESARLAKIDKHITPHAFRHSFATHPLQNGYDTQHLRLWAGVPILQELLGHKDVKTTMTPRQARGRSTLTFFNEADSL